MNRTDEEILIEYQIYKIRRRKKILLITIPVTLLLVLSIVIFGSLSLSEDKQNNVPIIKLEKNSITINVNEEIDYTSFIKNVSDKEDGDIRKNIMYNKIDTNKEGTYEIIYSIVDKDKNKATAILTVTIKAVPKVEVEEKENVPVEQPNSNVEEVQPPINVPTPPPASTKPDPAPAVNKPPNKDFLFSDGTTNMGNAISVCEAYIGAFNGSCIELRDANGLVIGSRATFN